MLRLPLMIEARLTARDDAPPRLENILVSLYLYRQGNYYYGTQMGLTDAAGVVRITRDQIERNFAENQKLFLMDLKTPMAESDSVVGVVIRGGADFRSAQRAVENNPLVRGDSRNLFDRAQNQHIESAEVKLDLSGALADTISITVPVREAQVP